MSDRQTVHIEFDKSAADIICWMQALPPRAVNRTVNEILSAESRGKTARVLYRFSYTTEVEPIGCQFIIRDKDALEFLAKIPMRKRKQTIINTIRKHIQINQKMPQKPFAIDEKVYEILEEFIPKMEQKEMEYAGTPDKYRKLCDCYTLAKQAIYREIHNRYQFVDENRGDLNLKNLDCGKIIDSVFESVFETAPKDTVQNNNQYIFNNNSNE